MRFYVLERRPNLDQSADITEFDAPNSTPLGPAPRCAVCGDAVGMLTLLPPFQVELTLWGHHYGDIACGSGMELLVSQRFRDGFLREGLTGIPSFIPAEVMNIKSRKKKIVGEMPRYFIGPPTRSRAAIDDEASGLVRRPPWTCEACRSGGIRRTKRIVFEPGTWSGEDIFIARGLPGRIFTSQRFKNFCDEHSFLNCVLMDADHFSFDYFPGAP
jgi:hypothetical protein